MDGASASKYMGFPSMYWSDRESLSHWADGQKEAVRQREQQQDSIQKDSVIVFQDLYKTQDTVGDDNKICFCRFLPFLGVRMNFAPVFIGLKILRICIFGV